MKIAKTALGLIVGILGFSLLTIVGLSLYHHVKLGQTIRTMEDAGLRNLVSVGDRSLNVVRTGKENGNHRIVVISGWGDGEASIGWHRFTEPFEQDNEFIFIDRAGYGLSDDNADGVTLEGTVQDYRSALQNSGVEGPYILMAHSLGGAYASYWVSNYPEEIEAVIILDGTVPMSDEESELYSLDYLSFTQRSSLNLVINSLYLFSKTGLIRFMPTGYEEFMYDLSDDDTDYINSMLMRTTESQAGLDELNMLIDSSIQNETWNQLITTDVPKIYIDATALNPSDYEILQEYEDENSVTTLTIPEFRSVNNAEEVTDDMIVDAMRAYINREYEDTLAYAERIGNCEVVNIPGDHVIFLDRTEDVQAVISDFLSRIEF